MAQTRTKIAAGGTIAALGALGAVAASGGSPAATNAADTTAAPVTKTVDGPVEVRTVVVHKVVHRTRHAKPKVAPVAVQPATAAPAAVSATYAATAPAPAVTRVVAPAPARTAPATKKPLSTHSSGGTKSGSGDDGAEHESERSDAGESGNDD